uniref:Uncharacterized protein n=1 Tax=Chaetoceros debilis TaxID=122233 RepID=A0A7S3V783_9STRA|mmetsp:Transcript_15842/g.23751  ORF Transcript_15842/g.23751 Transcript_15842/m.23751 type:complete len:134 (-) Transcript_15842:112-513(-)
MCEEKVQGRLNRIQEVEEGERHRRALSLAAAAIIRRTGPRSLFQGYLDRILQEIESNQKRVTRQRVFASGDMRRTGLPAASFSSTDIQFSMREIGLSQTEYTFMKFQCVQISPHGKLTFKQTVTFSEHLLRAF